MDYRFWFDGGIFAGGPENSGNGVNGLSVAVRSLAGSSSGGVGPTSRRLRLSANNAGNGGGVCFALDWKATGGGGESLRKGWSMFRGLGVT